MSLFCINRLLTGSLLGVKRAVAGMNLMSPYLSAMMPATLENRVVEGDAADVNLELLSHAISSENIDTCRELIKYFVIHLIVDLLTPRTQLGIRRYRGFTAFRRIHVS